MASAQYAAQLARAAAPSSLQREVDDLTHGRVGRATQVGTIIAGIVIAATLIIGLFVIAQIDSALPFTGVVDDPANSTLVSSKNSTVSRIGDGILLGSVIIIVLFASVILRVLRGL